MQLTPRTHPVTRPTEWRPRPTPYFRKHMFFTPLVVFGPDQENPPQCAVPASGRQRWHRAQQSPTE